MKRKWDSITELDFSNRAFKIFEKYRVAQSLVGFNDDYRVFNTTNVYDIIREIIELAETEHPLWNFGKFPNEK